MTFENNNANDQTNDSSIFNEMDVTEYFCKSGSMNYPEERMTIKYRAKNYNVAYKEIEKFNRNYNAYYIVLNHI